MSKILALDEVARACQTLAATALNIDVGRVTTSASVTERGEVEVFYRIDGEIPSEEENQVIIAFIDDAMLSSERQEKPQLGDILDDYLRRN